MLVLQRGGRLGRVVFRKDEKRPDLDVMDVHPVNKIEILERIKYAMWLRNYSYPLMNNNVPSTSFAKA